MLKDNDKQTSQSHSLIDSINWQKEKKIVSMFTTDSRLE